MITMKSVIEDYVRELGKDLGNEELELGADYHAAQLMDAFRDQIPDIIMLPMPAMGNPPNPLELVLNEAVGVLHSWSYAEENPERAEAGWDAEYREDEFRFAAVNWLRSRGWIVTDETDIGGELRQAVKDVVRAGDGDLLVGPEFYSGLSYAEDLVEEVRRFAADRGFTGLSEVSDD